MEIFQLIGSMFQTPSQLPDNSMTQDKNVSVPGGKLQSGSWAGTLLFDGRASGSKISKEDIGAPCDFKHVAHVGWESRFATYIVNSDMQILFSRAGIREEHLKDRRTSRRIFEIIERKGGMEAVRQEALSLALSDESRSINSSEMSSSADNSGDPMSASVLPPLPLNHCASINSLPPPPSLPSFDNSEVASDPIPPPPPALECCTSYSARSSTAPPCNCDVIDSVQIQPPPLPNSLGCLAVDLVPMIPPPPPPLPFVKNQTSIGSLTLPHPPAFDNSLVEPPSLLPLAPAEQNAFTIDRYCNDGLNAGIYLSPPSPPPYIPSVPVDSSTLFPSPLDHLQSDNPRLLPQPLNPSQSERSGCPKEKSETASEKQMDQPGLLEQIRRGMLLKAVHVDVKVTGVTDQSSRPPTENKGIVSALMDVIQKRHLAFQFSSDELEGDEGWDD